MAPRESGFADYIVMPKRNPVSLPDYVALSIAALAEPTACDWHTVRKATAALNKKDKDIQP